VDRCVDLAGSQRVDRRGWFGAQADQLGLGLRVAPDALEEIAQQGLGFRCPPGDADLLPDSAAILLSRSAVTARTDRRAATMSTE